MSLKTTNILVGTVILLTIALGLLSYISFQTSQEKEDFIQTKSDMSVLYEKIKDSTETYNPKHTSMTSNCGSQNIGKLEQDLTCFTKVEFVFSPTDRESALLISNEIELQVQNFSKTPDYKSQTPIDREDSWLHYSMPTTNNSDKIMCKFDYEYLKSAPPSLIASLICSGNARQAYFPLVED